MSQGKVGEHQFSTQISNDKHSLLKYLKYDNTAMNTNGRIQAINHDWSL